MKKLTLLVLLAGALTAGPLKVATYPMRHPVKTVKGVVKGTYKAGKAILW